MLISPFMMGVKRIHDGCEKNSCMSKSLYFESCPICSTNLYKNNAGYCDGDSQSLTDVNKRKGNVAKNSVASVETDGTTLGIF